MERDLPSDPDTALGHPPVRMTEEEFMRLDGYHAEWVEGVTYFMSPVTVDHDDIRNFLIRVLGDICEERSFGKVHGEPFAVKLFPGIIRSPDVLVVTKRQMGKLKRTRFEGGPDVVFEIVSPESVAKDYREKYHEYMKAGVREYWIIDPLSHTFEVHRLRGRKYAKARAVEGRVASKVVPGFFFDEAWLKSPLPKKATVLKQMGL